MGSVAVDVSRLMEADQFESRTQPLLEDATEAGDTYAETPSHIPLKASSEQHHEAASPCPRGGGPDAAGDYVKLSESVDEVMDLDGGSTAMASSSGGIREDFLAIEMQPLPTELAGVATVPTGETARHCFICLQDEKENGQPLESCCSTCYACTHRSCWYEWRRNQRGSALRSRLFGAPRVQTSQLLQCSICKSGTAVMPGEESALSWMDEICGGQSGRTHGNIGRALIRLLGAVTDSDDDSEIQLDGLLHRACGLYFGVVYVVMLLFIVTAACVLIVRKQFYTGDVVLCCVIALYEVSVLQVAALAISWHNAQASVEAPAVP